MVCCDLCRTWLHEECLMSEVRKEYIESTIKSLPNAEFPVEDYIDVAVGYNRETGGVTGSITHKLEPKRNEAMLTTSQFDVNHVLLKCLKCKAYLK